MTPENHRTEFFFRFVVIGFAITQFCNSSLCIGTFSAGAATLNMWKSRFILAGGLDIVEGRSKQAERSKLNNNPTERTF